MDGPPPLTLTTTPQALHAVELRTPEYTFKAGTWFARPSSPAAETAGPRLQAKREPIIKSLELDTFVHEVCVGGEGGRFWSYFGRMHARRQGVM